MSTRIRLQRHGKKKSAYYHIVIADQRAKRDGKNIERIGNYNPNTNPATIDLDFDRALYWLQTGAEPSDTARAILSYKGVMYKYHLMNGVKKGALSDEEVERRFKVWIEEKESRIQAKKDSLKVSEEKSASEKKMTESTIKEKRAAKILSKQAPVEVEVEPAAELEQGAVAEGATPDNTGAEDSKIADVTSTEKAPEAETKTPEAEVKAPEAEAAPEVEVKAPEAEKAPEVEATKAEADSKVAEEPSSETGDDKASEKEA